MINRTCTEIPFEAFTNFERVPNASPLLTCDPDEWAAAAHATVAGDRVHYIWSIKNRDSTWDLMHSSAPVDDPGTVEHDPRNPIIVPAGDGSFDDHTIEYPFPFLNPFDGKYYMYYLGKRERVPKQTGLMVMDRDFGTWKRITDEPVIPAEFDYEEEERPTRGVPLMRISCILSIPGKPKERVIRTDHITTRHFARQQRR